jgi:hypothetical protein
MSEEWVTLIDFPMYHINMSGEIVNRRNNRQLAPSVNGHGVVKVGLFRDGKQYTRSVATLVASIFVSGRNENFNTVIHLDGDLSNCHVDNLMWRPKWFTYVYHRQFSDPNQREVCLHQLGLIGPIYDIRDNTYYENILDAAMTNGLLIRDVFARTMDVNNNNQVWPTGQEFRIPGQGKDILVKEHELFRK